jgi:hypothetical protein
MSEQDENLDDMPAFDFFQDACASLARNVCILLRAAGEPVTTDNILRVVHSMPWTISWTDTDYWKKSYCYQMLSVVKAKDYRLWDRLYDYLVINNTKLSYNATNMREAAFDGILAGIDWETVQRGSSEVPVTVSEKTPTKRGWLKRWAARRGGE